MFLAPWFAVAGLIAATGPILIHLLNRRRYRVVQWGAMDFLREAVFRSRRIMQMRDLLLLALRTLCILTFGAALARPFLDTSVVGIDADQPVHSVLLIDNSLSMAYRKGDGTLLDEAKSQAKDLIEQLPRGSRISVLPICGSASGIGYSACYTKDDALQRLAAIEPVDRAAMPRETIDLALDACDRAAEMPAKEIVLLGDQQISDWPTGSLAAHLQKLPVPIKVVQFEPDEITNAWVSAFKLRDRIVDRRTPAVFVATVRYEGAEAQNDVQVSLSVDELKFDVQQVELQPGQTREVEFAPYLFENPESSSEHGDAQLGFAAAEVAVEIRQGGVIEPDGLPADDRRFLVVSVVEKLPVVFVDQWGDEEQPQLNRYGETFHLRRLLAPAVSRSRGGRQLADSRHVRIDQLDRSLLQSARLVVIAGVATPVTANGMSTVPLLREYVQQGGNLVIAAGGNFDPAMWTAAAWQDGLGILPAPLSPVTVGKLSDESSGPAEVFQLAYGSMKSHDYFLLEGASDEELQDLYRLPYFFKTVVADAGDEVKDAMIPVTAEHLQQRNTALADIDRQLAELNELESKRELSPAQRDRRDDLDAQRAELQPDWLLWANKWGRLPAGQMTRQARCLPRLSVEELAEATRFSVLARYTNQIPYLIERRIGRGKVLFVASGVYSGWNTLSLTNTVLIFDRIFRDMLGQTLPERSVSSQRPYELPIAAAQRNARITLSGPDGLEELLAVDPVGANGYGVTVDQFTRRGHYRVTAARPTKSSSAANTASQSNRQESPQDKLWEVPLAVNGPAEESELVSRAVQFGDAGAGVVDTAQAFATAGFKPAQLHAADLWKWLLLGVLAGLLLELVILARYK